MRTSWNDFVALLSGANADAMGRIGMGPFLFLLAVALASAFLISALYLHFYARTATGSQLHRGFPFVGLALAGLFIAVQFSLPLSLGLLGALSVVRFRTPIKEPEEVAFLMLVVAAAAACASFKLVFLGLLLATAAVGLALQQALVRRSHAPASRGTIVLSVPSAEFEARAAAIRRVLDRHHRRTRLGSLSEETGQIVLSYDFHSLSSGDLQALQLELQSQAASPGVDVFYDRVRA
jgi:hypothetical protein